MFKALALVFVLLGFSGPCCAQTVTLAIVRLGCGTPLSPLFSPPASPQEREQISTEWVGPDELAVEAWDDATADSQIDANTAKLRLEGTTVTISYAHRNVAIDRRKPVPECMFLAKLFFTISGLPRSHYQLRLENGRSAVHLVEIDG